MGKTVVDELITLLSLEDDKNNDKAAKQFEDRLENISKSAIKLGGVLVAVAGATFAAVSKFADGADEGAKFAKSIDLAYDKLQELEYAQKKFGGSTDSLRGDLAKITQTMASPIPGEFNQALLLMGIRTRKTSGEMKTADDIMADLAKKFDGLDNRKAQQLGSKLGLSQATIRMLQSGTANIAELRKEAHALGAIIPPETAENAEEFSEQMVSAKAAVGGIGADIAGQLLPVMIELVVAFREFVAANGRFIAMAIGPILRAIAQGFKMFLNILLFLVNVLFVLLVPLQLLIRALDKIGVLSPLVTAALIAMTAALVRMAVVAAAGPLLGFISNGIKAIAVIKNFITVLAALKAFALPAFLQMAAAAFVFVAPFLAIAAAVTAVILVLQDLYKFFTGGDSVTGRIVDWVKKMNFGGGGEGDTGGAGPGRTATSAGTRSGVPGSVVNNGTSTVNGGDTNITVHGAGDPRAVGADVASRAGMGRASQVLKPGNRAPVVG